MKPLVFFHTFIRLFRNNKNNCKSRFSKTFVGIDVYTQMNRSAVTTNEQALR